MNELFAAYDAANLRGRGFNLRPRPPATEAQITSCEHFLGRTFPPSYRKFLRYTNGCEGYYKHDGLLFGTEDYRSNEEARELIASVISALVDTADAPVPAELWPEAIAPEPIRLYPENFYPFVDRGVILG